MKRKKQTRSGTAVVELAVCLPLIFTIIFGSIEACNMIALKQILSEAAYDGALMALRSDSDETAIISNINSVLAARNITPSNVQIQGPGGSNFDSITHGQSVSVTVEAQTDGNVLGPQLFGLAKTLSAVAIASKQ
jgi:Flp pilus assembly protein TadG